MKQHESCGKNPAAEEKGFLFSFFFVEFLGSGWKNDASAAAPASLVKLKQSSERLLAPPSCHI